jgi:hypothetical protein
MNSYLSSPVLWIIVILAVLFGGMIKDWTPKQRVETCRMCDPSRHETYADAPCAACSEALTTSQS